MHNQVEPSHHQIAEILTDNIISEMTSFLMEDYDYTLEKALELVYTSRTIEHLQNEDTELYVQSSSYVYDMLIQELGLYPPYNNFPRTLAAEEQK